MSYYINQKFEVKMEHKIGTFLIPCYKQLKFLTAESRNEVLNEVKNILLKSAAEVRLSNNTVITSVDNAAIPKKSRWQKYSDNLTVTNDCCIERELKSYLSNSTLTEEIDSLKWWQLNTINYPYLSNLAKKTLAIPASSASSERNFSAAGRFVEERRSRLAPENVDKLLFLHSNLLI